MSLDTHDPSVWPWPTGPAPILTSRTIKNQTLTRLALAQRAMGEEFRWPLYPPIAQGRLALCLMLPGQTPPLAALDATKLPAIILVLADDERTRFGPDAWPYVRRVLRWARGALVHATGGQAAHYSIALASALRFRRLLLVETATCHADAWADAAVSTLPRDAVLQIQAPPGDMHPRVSQSPVLH